MAKIGSIPWNKGKTNKILHKCALTECNNLTYNTRFCSLSCSGKFGGSLNKGQKHTEEWKQEHSLRVRGEKNGMYGQTHSEEAREKIGNARRGKQDTLETKQRKSQAHKGKKNPNQSRIGVNNGMYGRTHSEEAKLAIRLANTGREWTAEQRLKRAQISRDYWENISEEKKQIRADKISRASKGKIVSSQTRNKISLARVAFYARNYNSDNSGGYPVEWNARLRKHIKMLDGNLCAVCSSTYRMQVHHIDCIKTNCSIDNLITLCTPCHTRFHSSKNNSDSIIRFQYWTFFRAA